MSSLLAVFARGAPKAAGLMAGSGAGARATRIRSVRMLSAGPLSGLSRPVDQNSDSALLSRPSALASATRGGSLPHQTQQRRLMSIESHDSKEETHEAAAAEEGEAVDAAPTGTIEDTAAAGVEEVEKVAEAPTEPAMVPLVQVDGIPFAMTQQELEEWFAEAGCAVSKLTMPVWSGDSVRSGQNKGRAFVEMASEEDTQNAINLNGRSIGERWVGIARLAMPLAECRTVSVKGMKGCSEGDLFQLFEDEVGTRPSSVKVIENPNRAQGLAFVGFATPEEANKALALDGMSIMNQWIDVSLHMTKQGSRDSGPAAPTGPPFGADVSDSVVILLRGLPFSLTEDEIKSFLLQNDLEDEDIVEMKVPKYNATRFNTGIAYLHMKDEDAASKTFALKGSYIGDRWVDVSRWNQRSDSGTRLSHKSNMDNARTTVPAALRKKYPDLPCVIVSGLPFSKTRDEIINYLVENGVPQEAMQEMQMPLFLQTQNNTGACWIVINQEEAYNRLMELNGAIIDDRWITIADA